MTHWICEACCHICTDAEVLRAPNPFDPSFPVVGCPTCRLISTLTQVCDVDGCVRRVSCGTPTASGYRWTCGEHQPEEARHGIA